MRLLTDKSESLNKNVYYGYYKEGIKRGGIFYGVIFFIIGFLLGVVTLFLIGISYG
jgi:hypothetical protein